MKRLLAAAALAVLVAAGVGGAAAANDNDSPAATTAPAPTAPAPGAPPIPDCEDATLVIKDGKIYANGKEIGKVEKAKVLPDGPPNAPTGVGVDAGGVSAAPGSEGPVLSRVDETPDGAVPAKGASISVHSEDGKVTVTEGEFDGEPPSVPGKPGEPGTASSAMGESGPSVHVEGAPKAGSEPQMIVACSVKTVQAE